MKARDFLLILLVPGLFSLGGCAHGHNREILWGMVAGAAVGALVGNQFVHHGQYNQYRSENTAITSAVFALGTGAVMNWHYDALQEREVEISGRFARTRLCDPSELDQNLVKQLSGGAGQGQAVELQKEQIGKFAISLDDETKWALPAFQKRFLQPDRGETQMLSSRYIWEIIRPGRFVTRSQNPDFFVEPSADKPADNKEKKP